MLSSCGRKGFPSPHLLLPALLHLGQLLAAPGHAPELLLCIAVGFGTCWERGGVRVRGCSVPGTPVPLPTDTGVLPLCCGAERGGTLRTLSGVALLPVGCGDPPRDGVWGAGAARPPAPLTCFALGSGGVELGARIHEVTDGEQPAAPVTGVENSILRRGGGERGAGTGLSPVAAPDPPSRGPPHPAGGHRAAPPPPRAVLRAGTPNLAFPEEGELPRSPPGAPHGGFAHGRVLVEGVEGPPISAGTSQALAWAGRRWGCTAVGGGYRFGGLRTH